MNGLSIELSSPQMEKSLFKLSIALCVYVTSLIAANTLGIKLMPFLFGTHLSVGAFSFPVVFLMTDVIGEIYGKRIAKMFVWAGLVSTGLFIAYTLISLAAPWANEARWVEAGYRDVFGISIRIGIASLVAFFIAEYQDVLSFFFFRRKLGAQNFWLRSALSNVWSQFIDTTIFMVIAFAGVYAPRVLLSIIISWWLYKIAMGLLYTPLSYVGLYFLRDRASNNNERYPDQNPHL